LLQSARSAMESLAHRRAARKTGYTSLPHIPIEIVGVGFWDDPHGQRGLKSGFELHPVLSLRVL